jgi:hypothetical protein
MTAVMITRNRKMVMTTTTALAGRVDETASSDVNVYFRSHPENDRSFYLGHEAELAGEYASK